MAAGDQTSSILRVEGTIVSSGRNVDGQLGHGDVQVFADPSIKVSGAWRSLSVGLTHTLAIKDDGTLWAWGDNSSGQLGDGSIDPASVPVLIDGGTAWTKVVAGPTHSAALKGNSLYVWGSNVSGQVGNNSTATALAPVQISGSWQDVALGLSHTLGVKFNGNPLKGDLYTWGANGSGQLGRTKSSTNQLTPLRVGSSSEWTKVAAGDQHSLGLQSNNLYVWGQNAYGQLGTGNNTESSAPVKIATAGWNAIAASGANSAGILTGGSLYVWGNVVGETTDFTVESKGMGSAYCGADLGTRYDLTKRMSVSASFKASFGKDAQVNRSSFISASPTSRTGEVKNS